MKEKKFYKKIVIITSVSVVLAGIILILCLLWMRTPGIHFLFGFMRADTREMCYIYDAEKDEFLGQTEVIIKGKGNGITKRFKGEMSVEGYKIEGEPIDYTESFMQGSVWKAHYTGTGKLKRDKNGEEYWGAGISKYSYVFCINTKNSDEYCVIVLGENDEYLHIIHATSEKEAKSVYQKLILPSEVNEILE